MIHQPNHRMFLRTPGRSIAFMALLAALLTGTTLVQGQSSKGRPSNRGKIVVFEDSSQVSLTQPRIHVQLRDGKRTLIGEGIEFPGLDLVVEEDGATSFPAFLDTGAGSFVISAMTAQRFGIETDPKSVYIDVGLHGETEMAVSQPYTVLLADSQGTLNDAPGQFNVIEKNARMQLSESRGGMGMAMLGSLDVIGMPAIRKHMVEIDLRPMLSKKGAGRQNDPTDFDSIDQLLEMATDALPVGPAVRLHSPRQRMRDVDYTVPLVYKDFNRRRHPDRRGALPTLAENPMIVGVTSEIDGGHSIADWLLDTGAAASIISTRHAISLGIYNNDMTPKKEPSFSLPLAGISGQADMAPGYVLDHIRVKAERGVTLEFRNVSVVVKDISIVLDDGSFVLLDGIFGMNLLFPGVSGLGGGGMPSDFGSGHFRKIWIDGARGKLGLVRNH